MLSTEITQAMWEAVCQGVCEAGDRPSKFKGNSNPVDNVSWNHRTKDFLPKLNNMLRSEGYTYRLPTEAEWEYAAWGEKTGKFGVDGEPKEFAWIEGNSGEKTNHVGKLKPNKYGLYDMHGNVWEWVQDSKVDFTSTPVVDPLGEFDSTRELRGGSWYEPTFLCVQHTAINSLQFHMGQVLGFES